MPMSEQDFESSFVSENQAISFEINMRAKRQCFLSKKGEREGGKNMGFSPSHHYGRGMVSDARAVRAFWAVA